MNKRMIFYIIGAILLIEAALLLAPAAVALVYAEKNGLVFLYVALGAALAGFGAMRLSRPRNRSIYAKEGLIVVALSWIVLSLVGALPFSLTGQIPDYLDAVFETVSGFTTTGASILREVESLDHCTLFWRCFTHWIGGMGILVFMMGILRLNGGQGIHLLRAESPGPAVAKMVPRMTDSSKILYAIYLVLTVLQFLLYLVGGMPVFEALCHAVATAGTGGFSVKNDSFASYSPYLQTVTTVFMGLFGVNFSIYFFLLRKKFDLVVKNTELRWYIILILASSAAIALNVMHMYGSFGEAFHHSSFSVLTVMSTTGFGTADFCLWPEFSRVLLVLLMCVGACAGSTGGGFKVSRIVILYRTIQSDVRKLLHPNAVKVARLDGKKIDDETIRSVSTYFILYVLIMLISVILISLENFDASTTVTSVIAAFNNIGPGLGLVCPSGNYSMFSPLSKIVLCLDMLFGRLEIDPMLLLVIPVTWRKR